MRLIFVNHDFSSFVNADFRKLGPAVDYNMYEIAFGKD